MPSQFLPFKLRSFKFKNESLSKMISIGPLERMGEGEDRRETKGVQVSKQLSLSLSNISLMVNNFPMRSATNHARFVGKNAVMLLAS